MINSVESATKHIYEILKIKGIKTNPPVKLNAKRDWLIKTSKGVFYCKFQRDLRYTKPNPDSAHSRYLTMNLDLFSKEFDFLCICMSDGRVYCIDKDKFGINSECTITKTQDKPEKVLNCDIVHFTNLENL